MGQEKERLLVQQERGRARDRRREEAESGYTPPIRPFEFDRDDE